MQGMKEMQDQSLGWGNPLEEEMTTHSCSCLENPTDRGAWQAAVQGVTKSQTQLKWLSMHACITLAWWKSWYLIFSSLSIFEIETEIFHVDISISGEKICYRQVCVIDLSPNCVFKVNCCNIIYSLEIQ